LKYQFFFVFVILLLADLGIKYCVNTQDYSTFTIIPSVLDFLFVKNTGVAFSFLSSSNILIQGALILIIVCALTFLIYSFLNAKRSLEKTAFTLIISGGFGNLIERIISGYVTDYLYLHLGNFSLFVFNFADLLITIGACIIIFLWLSGNEQKD
tara:strand:+ start:112 stop:573 length:462 start_codon:yes stop_codon:yes gene_type:complete